MHQSKLWAGIVKMHLAENMRVLNATGDRETLSNFASWSLLVGNGSASCNGQVKLEEAICMPLTESGELDKKGLLEWVFPRLAERSTGLHVAHQRLAFAKAMLESRAPTHELYRAPPAMAPEPEDGIYEEDENQVRWSALATCEWRPPEYLKDVIL